MPTRNAHACAGESGGSAVSIRYWAKSRWSLNFKWIPSLKRALCAERGEFDGRRTENRSLLYHILIFIKIEAPKLLNIGQFSVFFWKTGARGFKSLCYNKNTAVHTDDGIVAEKEGFEVRSTPACGARKKSRALRRSIFSTAAPPACSLIPPPAALAINARAERRAGSNPFVITKIPPSIRTAVLWRRRRDLNPRAAIRDLHP